MGVETEAKVDPKGTRQSDVFFPPPQWSDCKPESLEFSSVESFLMLLHDLRQILLCELEKHPHDLIHNFLCFYEEFLKQDLPLEAFFLNYKPRHYPSNPTCLALNAFLMDQIKKTHGGLYAQLSSALYVASCRNMIPDGYTSHSPPVDDLVTQHTVVVLKVSIEGREGYVVMDTGYYIPVPVVVMADGLYPHTGWFAALERYENYYEKYNYVLEGDYIVVANHRVFRGKGELPTTDAIFVGGAYLNGLERAEKRNLVTDKFRMLFARDRKGLLAGFHLTPFTKRSFTFIHGNESGRLVKVKIPFDYFLGGEKDSQIEDAIATCITQMRMDRELVSQKIRRLVEAYSNPRFAVDAARLDKEFKDEYNIDMNKFIPTC